VHAKVCKLCGPLSLARAAIATYVPSTRAGARSGVKHGQPLHNSFLSNHQQLGMCCALFRSSPNSGLQLAGVRSELPGGKKNSCGAPVASTATGGDDKAQKWKKQSGDLRAAMQASREVSRRCSQLYACNKSCCMIGGMLSLSGSPFVSAFACYIGHSAAKRQDWRPRCTANA
jgi:hypothetical protein